MDKLNLLMRAPWMWDYNNVVSKINEIIDYITRKVERKDIQIVKCVKDYHFFKWKKVDLPYQSDYIITTLEELYDVLSKYNIEREISTLLIDLVNDWTIVNLSISITEDITEKDKKQMATFETIETQPIEEVKPKKKTTKKTTTKKTTTKKKTK